MKISKRPGEEFTILLKGKQLSQESHFLKLPWEPH